MMRLYLSDMHKSQDLWKAAGSPSGGGRKGPSMKLNLAPKTPGAATGGSGPQVVDCPLGGACPDGGRHQMGSKKLQKHTKQVQAQAQTGQKVGDESEGKDASKPGVSPGTTNLGGLGSDQVEKPAPRTPPPLPGQEHTPVDTGEFHTETVDVSKEEPKGHPDFSAKEFEKDPHGAKTRSLFQGTVTDQPGVNQPVSPQKPPMGSQVAGMKLDRPGMETKNVPNPMVPDEANVPPNSKPMDHYKLAQISRESGDEQLAGFHEDMARKRTAGMGSEDHRKLAEDLDAAGMHDQAKYHRGIHQRVTGGANAPAGKDPHKPAEMSADEFKNSGAKVFKTAKGSHYIVHGGKTTRMKASGIHAGDEGLKDTSHHTVYVDGNKYSGLGRAGAKGVDSPHAMYHNGHLVFVSKNSSGKYGIDSNSAGRSVPPEDIHREPAVGLTPVEMWRTGKEDEDLGVDSYGNYHVGHEISEVGDPTDAHHKLFGGKDAGGAQKPHEEVMRDVHHEARTKAKADLDAAKKIHEETKAKADKIRASNEEKQKKYDADLAEHTKKKEAAKNAEDKSSVPKVGKPPEKPKLDKEEKVPEKPDLYEPENDADKLRHEGHTDKAKRLADLAESHIKGNKNLSSEQKARLERAHRMAAYHANIAYTPTAAHRKELGDVEAAISGMGIKQSHEEMVAAENARKTAEAAKQAEKDRVATEKQQAKQAKLDEKTQAQEAKQQAKTAGQQPQPPETDLDHARVADHKAKAQELRDNVESHMAANPDMSPDERTRAEHILSELDKHEQLDMVPGSDHEGELKELQKLAGAHGKKKYEPDSDGEGGGGGVDAGHNFAYNMLHQGRALGATAAAAATNPYGQAGQLGSAVPSYAVSGATSAGHHLLRDDDKKPEPEKQPQQPPGGSKRPQQSSMKDTE